MKNQNVAITNISDLLTQEDKARFLKVFNRWSWLNKQNFNSKKIVSFYDDDENFLICVSVPFTEDDYGFDCNLLDLLDYLSSYCGATAAKYDGMWL